MLLRAGYNSRLKGPNDSGLHDHLYSWAYNPYVDSQIDIIKNDKNKFSKCICVVFPDLYRPLNTEKQEKNINESTFCSPVQCADGGGPLPLIPLSKHPLLTPVFML